MSNPPIIEHVQGTADFGEVQSKLGALEKRFEASREKVANLYASGKIDTSAFNRAMDAIDARIAQTQKAKERLDAAKPVQGPPLPPAQKEPKGGDSGLGNRGANLASNAIQNFAGVSGDASQALDLLIDGNIKAAAAVGGLGLATFAVTKGLELYNAKVKEQQQAVALTATSLADYNARMAQAGTVMTGLPDIHLKILGIDTSLKQINLQVYKDMATYAMDAANAHGTLAQKMHAANEASNANAAAGYAVSQAEQEDLAMRRKQIEATHGVGQSAYQYAQQLAAVTTVIENGVPTIKAWADMTDIQRNSIVAVARELQDLRGPMDARASASKAMSQSMIDDEEKVRAAYAATHREMRKGDQQAPQGQSTEEKSGIMEAQQANSRMQARADNEKFFTDKLKVETDKRIAEAERWAAAQKAAADSVKSSLESMATGMMTKSQVDPKDERRRQLQAKGGGASAEEQKELASLGSYVDKVDENRRRLESIKLEPKIDHELLAKLPADMQAELKAAFASGGGKGMAELAQTMLNKGGGFGDIRLMNADMIADKIADQIAEASAKKDLMAIVMQKLQAKGINPNSAFVQRALGVTPEGGPPNGATANMPQAAQMTAQAITGAQGEDKGGGMATAFAPAAKGFEDALKGVNVGQALQAAVTTSIDGIAKAGTFAGEKFGANLAKAVGEAGGAVSTAIIKELKNFGDARYLRVAIEGLVE